MKSLAIALALCILAPAVASAEDCFLCGSDSTGACDGARQCRGTREHCREVGCKITGTASCSDAANVKICSSDAATSPSMAVSVVQTQSRIR